MSRMPPARLQSVGIVALFICWATLCTVSSKKVMTEVVASSNFLFLVQGIVSIVGLHISATLGMVERSVVKINVTGTSGRRRLLIAVSYSINVACGLCSLFYVNLPAFGALKRLTTVACWVGEYYLFRTRRTTACAPSLIVLVIGTIVAGWHDMEFSALGYFFGVASSAGQGVAFVLSKTLKGSDAGPKDSLSTVLEVVYLNAVVSSAMMACVLTVTGWDGVLRDGASTLHGYSQIGLNAACILFLNVVIFLDCTMNTPLTHTVAGNVKATVASLIGVLMFGTEINYLGGVGLLLNLVGGVWYSILIS